MHRSFPADSSRIESASTLGLRPRRHFATLANGLALGAAAFYCLTAGLVGDIRASKAGQPTACDPRPRNARIKLSQPPDSFNPPGPIPPILRISIPPSQSKRPSTAFRGWRTAQSRRRAHRHPPTSQIAWLGSRLRPGSARAGTIPLASRALTLPPQWVSAAFSGIIRAKFGALRWLRREADCVQYGARVNWKSINGGTRLCRR